MKNNKIFVVLFAVFCLFVMAGSVFADQDGYTRWCNVDDYGCTVTNDQGGQDYIMFWSEEARQYIMGSLTAPYTNVTYRCPECSSGRLLLDGVKSVTRAAGKTIYIVDGKTFTSKDALLEYIAETTGRSSCYFAGNEIKCK